MTLVEDFIALFGVGVGASVVFVASRSHERSKGKNIFAHLIVLATGLACFFLLPGGIKGLLFTPISVVIVGTVIPIYESIRAACTVGMADDTTWLSYWITQGIVSFSTEWMDGFGDSVSCNWHLFEFFFYLWLSLPVTDGAHLIFNLVLHPLVGPIIQPLVQKTEGVINKIILAVTNAAHLGFVWIAFVFLPANLKRGIWIAIATIYPLSASIVSVTTDDEADDTFWLVYCKFPHFCPSIISAI